MIKAIAAAFAVGAAVDIWARIETNERTYKQMCNKEET